MNVASGSNEKKIDKKRGRTQEPMWLQGSVFYHIYPLGFCNAPLENDGLVKPRIQKVAEWADHLEELGITAVYFSPIFESDHHGYDTRDYFELDCRLGTNEDFALVSKTLHQAGIKVVLDGVFNHVGRGFWAFEDVKKNRTNSRYKDWFCIEFNRDSNYHDGFWYDGWEGHYELVKLNLHNPEVVDHLLKAVQFWVDEFQIDGLRLDVAYSLDREFLKRLRTLANQLGEQRGSQFALIGEVLFGDYNLIVNDQMLHSCTNYECYKGIFSSLNDQNMFEISYSLNRQYGKEQWCLYRGKHLLNFLDNHDVTRIASILTNKNHLPLAYGLLFGMPGIPCIYYGSEWGIPGEKKDGDAALRPQIEKPDWNGITDLVQKLSRIHEESKAICSGEYENVVVTNKQFVFKRSCQEETIYIGMNLEATPFQVQLPINQKVTELITGNSVQINNKIELEGYGLYYWKC